MNFDCGGITTSEIPARVGLNMSASAWMRLPGRHCIACANSLTSGREPSTPSTVPTQIIWSEGGARRDSLPFLIARISGAFSSVSASPIDRKSTRLNSSHMSISYAVFCLKKKKKKKHQQLKVIQIILEYHH